MRNKQTLEKHTRQWIGEPWNAITGTNRTSTVEDSTMELIKGRQANVCKLMTWMVDRRNLLMMVKELSLIMARRWSNGCETDNPVIKDHLGSNWKDQVQVISPM